MGRELQKRKRRSSRPTVRQSNQPKRPLNPMGNGLIAKNWNKKETLSQNYRRLGLTAKLGKATGGIEQRPSSSSTPKAARDPFAVKPSDGMRGAVQSVRVERDAEGKIVRVMHKANPLNDPLNNLESDSEDDDGDNGSPVDGGGEDEGPRETKVVDILEQQANMPTEKHIRHQSAREREWIERLVARHGDDTAAMARDAKLNPMQQTAAQIARKLRTYKERLGQ